ncbi:MAG: hypothetical protein HC904_11820 [Blastochloris sp.]|nr:hypothetical protein [Blastochloris sp.]
MIAVTRDEESANQKFRAKLKKYVESGNSKCIKVKSTPAPGLLSSKKGKAKSKKKKSDTVMTTLGELVNIPEHDITHLFNNEAMLAVSHAIEDMASEYREGELISTFQRLENFGPQKKRYVGLSKDLDAVRVWGEGTPPKGCSRIDFIPIFRPELMRYWVVLFASPKASAVLVCRQVNQTDSFQKKIFAGFYSFNPFLVESIRRQFNLMSCGLDYIVNEWEKDYHFGSPALKEINRYFQTPTDHA